jgi:Zn ribbon nucleic-acid-binding protein
MINNETRKLIAQAVAKCIAYKNCDKQDMVDLWALKLLELLECNDIIDNMIVGKSHLNLVK